MLLLLGAGNVSLVWISGMESTLKQTTTMMMITWKLIVSYWCVCPCRFVRPCRSDVYALGVRFRSPPFVNFISSNSRRAAAAAAPPSVRLSDAFHSTAVNGSWTVTLCRWKPSARGTNSVHLRRSAAVNLRRHVGLRPVHSHMYYYGPLSQPWTNATHRVYSFLLDCLLTDTRAPPLSVALFLMNLHVVEWPNVTIILWKKKLLCARRSNWHAISN